MLALTKLHTQSVASAILNVKHDVINSDSHCQGNCNDGSVEEANHPIPITIKAKRLAFSCFAISYWPG